MTQATEPARTLTRHAEPLAVVRLGAGADVPDWVGGGTLVSVTATAAETSVVCAAAAVPRKARPAGPFTAFEVAGPLDLGLTGVLAGLLGPLAAAGVAVFTVSTYDTDWVLVPSERADDAAEAWRRSGHAVRPADDHRSLS
jgi:hypothetical protein